MRSSLKLKKYLMKYNTIIFFCALVISGCSNTKLFQEEISTNENSYKENISHENFIVTGTVKFSVEEKKISSRFSFIKNKKKEEIEFLDLFNNVIVAFEIKKNGIEIKNYKNNVNSDALEKLINRPIFKNIIINFSNILMANRNEVISVKKYKNGLLREIKNETYVVAYKVYNKEFLPVIMEIDFFNISFDLKILNWKIIK
tara:strand:- start:831 stop:1433 length:603 start_codon:yes stop_codon:yes gene_type:complete